MQPIEHRPSRHLSFLSILVVATFAGVVALATMIATSSGRDRALEQRWYGLLASGNPQILGTFRTTNLLVDNQSTTGSDATFEGVINSTFLGSDTGNACGERAASNWVGPACFSFSPTLNDGVRDVIDIEWGTIGSGASNSTEQISFVTHVQGNVDTTAAGAQAFGFQSSVHPTKSAGTNPLQCAAFQGGASGCDTNYSFQGNNGTLYNNEDIFIGSGGEIQGTFLMSGNSVTAGNTSGGSLVELISAVTEDRTVSVDPTGNGSHHQVGALGSATAPTGNDIGKYEAFAGNGKNVFLTFNNTLTGQQGFAAYNSANGAHDDLHWWQYNGIGQDVMVFQGVTGNVGFGESSWKWISNKGTPTANHGTLNPDSTNWVGNVTGIGSNTSVVLTYTTPFATTSWCQATANGAGTPELISVTRSASAPTFSCFNTTTGVAANCVDFSYNCVGE